ncbi:MAG: Gfo/Idh/MocA family oxidoreductase, partial [Spirochaetaceae bacterium]|nr:Gfo/Idh/MocA family oxidoreductase [Spirochaetaceae bacterium]
MNKIRIGSVGLGRLGLRHAENLAGNIQNARLVALCDTDKPKLEETADRLG